MSLHFFSYYFLSFDFVLLIRHIDVDFQGNFSFLFSLLFQPFVLKS